MKSPLEFYVAAFLYQAVVRSGVSGHDFREAGNYLASIMWANFVLFEETER